MDTQKTVLEERMATKEVALLLGGIFNIAVERGPTLTDMAAALGEYVGYFDVIFPGFAACVQAGSAIGRERSVLAFGGDDAALEKLRGLSPQTAAELLADCGLAPEGSVQ